MAINMDDIFGEGFADKYMSKGKQRKTANKTANKPKVLSRKQDTFQKILAKQEIQPEDRGSEDREKSFAILRDIESLTLDMFTDSNLISSKSYTIHYPSNPNPIPIPEYKESESEVIRWFFRLTTPDFTSKINWAITLALFEGELVRISASLNSMAMLTGLESREIFKPIIDKFFPNLYKGDNTQ